MSKRSTPSRKSRLPYLLGVVGVAAAALVFAVSTLGAQASSDASLTTIDVRELRQSLAGEITLLDVREPYEYEAGHVEGAQLMPLANVVALAADLPKDQPVYVVCRSGNRSLQASNALIEAGFQDVRNVDGGMIAWEAAGFDVAR